MELEKQIYKLHILLLSWHYARSVFKILFFTFLCLSIFISAIFVSLTFRQSERDLRLLTQDSKVLEKFENNTIYTVEVLNSELNIPVLQMKFAYNRQILNLKQTTIQEHNFTQQTLYIDSEQYSSSFDVFFQNFVDVETMFLVDFTQKFKNSKHDLMIYNTQSREVWFWKSWVLEKNSNFFTFRIIENFFILLQTLTSIFFISICCSFIIRIILLSFPYFSFIVKQIIIKIYRREQNNNENQDNWITLYLKLLDRNNKSNFQLLISYLAMLAFFIIIFNQGFDQAVLILFGKSIPYGLNILFMIAFYFLERDHQFILLQNTFYAYKQPIYFISQRQVQIINMFGYGFYYLGLMAFFIMSETIIFGFLYFFEIPALNWSRQSYYTPSEQRPRCFYLPVFQIEWIQDIPQIWTIFFSLCGRKYFDRQHLTYVDRNQILFHQILDEEDHID